MCTLLRGLQAKGQWVGGWWGEGGGLFRHLVESCSELTLHGYMQKRQQHVSHCAVLGCDLCGACFALLQLRGFMLQSFQVS